jgi:ubiquinone/menaquinone biosynthesis C-methylase UbiE
MFEQVSEDISRQHRIRIEEAKLIINDLQISDNSKILEVGCGSGVQAALFAEKTSFIISSDINLANVKLNSVPLIICSCEYLPFKGNTFDIVYSSCVLEHLKNRGLALREMKRVLKANGIMVCVVPTLMWKVLQMLTYYLVGLLSIIFVRNVERYYSKSHLGKSFIIPPVHGEFSGNKEECMAYMTKSWMNLLESHGFQVFKIKKLLLYAPLGRLRKKGITIIPPALKIEKITRLSSSIALFARLC